MTWASRRVPPGDEVVAVARRHWSGMVRPVVIAAGAVAGAVAAARASLPGAADLAVAAALVVALLRLGWCYVRWAQTPAVVTRSRLLLRRGLLRRPEVVELRDVRDVRMVQTRRQRALRAGDLEVDDQGGTVARIAGLAGPADLRRQLWRQVDRCRVPLVAGELERLDLLRRRGVISTDELVAEKTRLLRR
ncbi:MAG TPA: PH domain-containing protein [Acidimicrobiales bacterium]|nr:PH domain-containing protein [Acidimicrobiales bacterium]